MMLETLAGRLKWERTPSGIRAEMSPPLNKELVKTFALRAYFLSLYFALLQYFFNHIDHRPHSTMPTWGEFLGLGTLILVLRCLDTATTRKALFLDPTGLTIKVRSLFGVVRTKREYALATLTNLRFVAYSRKKHVKNEDHQNEIQIDKNYSTRVFFVGISEEEATALIARMMDIYPFPKYLPS